MSNEKQSGDARPKSKAVAAEVDSRKPPRHSQFKKGQSGNPKGRPRGSHNYATILKNEINDLIGVLENGKRRKLRKGHVMLRQLVNKAVGADQRAFTQIIDLMHRHGLFGNLTTGISTFSPEQITTMREVLDLFKLLKE